MSDLRRLALAVKDRHQPVENTYKEPVEWVRSPPRCACQNRHPCDAYQLAEAVLALLDAAYRVVDAATDTEDGMVELKWDEITPLRDLLNVGRPFEGEDKALFDMGIVPRRTEP